MGTINKLKEVNVITNTIQTQIKDQEEKIVEQNSNDLKMIKDQIQALEYRADKSHEEMKFINETNHKLTNDLEEQLANIEDVIDKKINSDIMPRIGHLDDIVSDLDKDIKSSVSDIRNE